ncbi:unnamed protein product [Closterium sp. NIES-65]|nr:unnamed protein product [Closterium sp. NIES-65]
MAGSPQRHRLAVLLAGLALRVFSPTAAAATGLHPSQAAVLAECQGQWRSQLRGWSKGGDCAQVEGVRCNAAGFIVSLNVTGRNLTGPIPHSLWNLTTLTQLDLTNNWLSGSIPAAIAGIAALRILSAALIPPHAMSGFLPFRIRCAVPLCHDVQCQGIMGIVFFSTLLFSSFALTFIDVFLCDFGEQSAKGKPGS